MVDFIMCPENDYVPANFLSHFGNIWKRAHPRAGMVVVVSTSRFANAMYVIVARLYPAFAKRNALAPTLDDARAFLRERKPQERTP
jgi:hypothetical protein